MITVFIIFSSLTWSAAIISQSVSIALIAAVSSLLNTYLALRIRSQAYRNELKIDEVAMHNRIVITRTDKGLLITDEEMRELEPRGGDWTWPPSP